MRWILMNEIRRLGMASEALNLVAFGNAYGDERIVQRGSNIYTCAVEECQGCVREGPNTGQERGRYS